MCQKTTAKTQRNVAATGARQMSGNVCGWRTMMYLIRVFVSGGMGALRFMMFMTVQRIAHYAPPSAKLNGVA